VARACQELPVGPRLAVTVAAVMGFVWAWFRTREGGTDERL
jgi:hypothetical protein